MNGGADGFGTDDLNLLGADEVGAGEGLAGQYVTLRVKSIDRNKLGAAFPAAKAGMYFVDASPKAALDAAMPFVVSKAKSYGVDLETTISDAPMGPPRAFSEFWPGLAVGAVVGGSGLLLFRLGKAAVRFFLR